MASVDATPQGTYRVRYRDPLGRSRSRTFKRKADATRFSHSVETDKQRGDWIDPRLGKATVRDWADRWFETVAIAPKTRHSYKGFLNNWVLPMLGDVPIANLDRVTVRDFAAARETQLQARWDRVGAPVRARLEAEIGTLEGKVGVLRKTQEARQDWLGHHPETSRRLDRLEREATKAKEAMRLERDIANGLRQRAQARAAGRDFGREIGRSIGR